MIAFNPQTLHPTKDAIKITNMKKNTISIFSYSDVFAFLKAFYINQKNSRSSWSYQTWANALKQSKATLVRVVNGDREISPQLEKKLCLYFQFTDEESKYFKLLVAITKINKLYPQLQLRVPEIENLKKKKFTMSTAIQGNELAHFLSMVENQWFLEIFSNDSHDLNIEQIQKSFHPSLQHIDFKLIADECLRLGLLQAQNGKLTFVVPESIYLDGKMTSLSTAVKRYVTVLELLKKMIQEDFYSGKSPEVNSRAFSIKMQNTRLADLTLDLGQFLQDLMATYQDPHGNLILDVQTFLAPIAKLPRASQTP